MSKESSKPIAPAHLASDDARANGSWWSRVPRGWIFLLLFVLSWLAVFLIWNGVAFVTGR
ncbi:MAG: hypothetical protein EOP22_06925 [Hyphomicrobiales bacterium]|nr:MAG: hypothetical protein EOP22_06925 [Hyphomicrobiales bacterium]